jgi:hypothetical protein
MTDMEAQREPLTHHLSKRVIRVTGALVFCAFCLVLVWVIFHQRLPHPAPAKIQEEGMAHVRQIVTTVAASRWGQTQRGQLLVSALQNLISTNRIIFTDQLADTGLTLRGKGGRKCIYIKVLITEQGQYQHNDAELMCDVLFHEALHVCTDQSNCIEQECDAFLAGLEARNHFLEWPRPTFYMIEGRSIGDFVLDRYPELSRHPDYKPMASDMNWLLQQSQLASISDNR